MVKLKHILKQKFLIKTSGSRKQKCDRKTRQTKKEKIKKPKLICAV